MSLVAVLLGAAAIVTGPTILMAAVLWQPLERKRS